MSTRNMQPWWHCDGYYDAYCDRYCDRYCDGYCDGYCHWVVTLFVPPVAIPFIPKVTGQCDGAQHSICAVHAQSMLSMDINCRC